MKSRCLAALVCLALAFTPFGINAAPATLTIPVIVSQTGPASFVGKDEVIAFQVLEKYVNAHGGLRGAPIHFDLHDDLSDPKVSVQLFNQIIASHPAVVLGSTLTATCGAIAALAKDNGPVVYCFSPGLQPEKGSYSFASSPSLRVLQEGNFGFARQKGLLKVAVISGIDASGLANEKASKEVLALPINREMHAVVMDNLDPASQSAAPQVEKIRAAKPDVIMAWVTGASFGTLLRSLHDAGVDIPIVTTGANANMEQMTQYASFLPSELDLPAFPYNLGEQALRQTPLAAPAAVFFQAYREANAIPSPAASPYVWDVAQIILSGYKTLGPNATARQMRDYILGLRHFVGVDGIYDFSSGDQHGLSVATTVVVRWNASRRDFDPITGLGGKPKT